jgi:hypothetical protein
MSNAITAFEEALRISQALDDPKTSIILEHLGTVHELQGENAAALEKYEQAKAIYQRVLPMNLPIIDRLIARVRGKMGG